MQRPVTRAATLAAVFAAAAATLAVGSRPAAGQVAYQTVALTGRQAAGAPAGVVYETLETPALNGAGQVAYLADLIGPGVTFANNDALYAGPAAAPLLVAREGDPAPGTAAGANYSFFEAPALNDAGQVAYLGFLTGPGVTGSTDRAIFAGPPAGPQPVARAGDPAPGTAAGVNYSTFNSIVLNDAGQVAYLTGLTGSGVTGANDRAIYAGPQLAAREGEPAPGTAAGVVYSTLNAPAVNDAGQVAYLAALTGTGVTSANNAAIYAGPAAGPQPVARTGSQARGTAAGVTYSTLGTPALSDAGQVAYLASLSVPGVSFTTNDFALYAGPAAAPLLVAREGAQAPGAAAGVVYSFFEPPALNDAGQVAYLAFLTGAGAPVTTDRGIYAGPAAAPQLVALRGDPAPGTAAGVTYSDFDPPALSDAGQVAYLAGLTGTGVTGANDEGLFFVDPVGDDLLIVREGSLFDVGGGDLRTIANGGIGFAVGLSPSDRTGLADDGTLAFRLSFTDGTSGIFTAVVPEPASLALLAAAATLPVRRRRGR